MTVKIYVEGGGDRRAQQVELRRAFSTVFEKCGFDRPRTPSVTCCGSRNAAYSDFVTSLSKIGDLALLLVDSEGPVAGCYWNYVVSRDSWVRPAQANDDQLHFMMELMESWFLADREALEKFFGEGFTKTSLPGRSDNVDTIPKHDVEVGIDNASRHSKRGKYHKGQHSADILCLIDIVKLKAASKSFREVIAAVRARSVSG